MRRFFSVSIAVLLFASFVQAQSSAQIKAGVNLANVSTTNDGDVDDANMLTSFHVGILGNIHIASVFMSVENINTLQLLHGYSTGRGYEPLFDRYEPN